MPPAEVVEAAKKRLREAAILFEHKEGSRMVDIKDIGTLVRSLGVNPTGMQINLLVDELATVNAEADNGAPSLLSLKTVETVLSKFLLTSGNVIRDDYHTLIRAFRAFDMEGNGFIEAEQMKLMLSSRGEPMTEEETAKMLSYAADENGRIYYVGVAVKAQCLGATARPPQAAHTPSTLHALCSCRDL
ncbi:hypothetical protein QJQ45_006026 [Haematococcus lacustris]|nr:hypothetical protein QJQ45_006026 [Haematococcus lacustris]